MAECLIIVLMCVVTSLCNLVETADIPYMRKTITDHFSENRNHVVNKAYKDAAMKFIYDEFKRFGLDTEYNHFSFNDPSLTFPDNITHGTFTNVIGILKGSRFGTIDDRIVGVGAHYDTVKTTKGVNDNGSGVAAMLETARQITQSKVKRTNTIIFIAFDLREYDRLGSELFVSRWIVPWALKNYGSYEPILSQSYGAIILDTVMDYNTSQNSQSLPQEQSRYFPNAYASVISNGLRGDFVNMIYREPSNDTKLAEVFKSFWLKDDRHQFGITALPLNVSDDGFVRDKNFPDIFRSDQLSLWLSASSAIFLTDSANLRGDMRHCYHKMCDDLETMLTDDNLNFLGKTADTIVKTLESLTGSVTSSAEDVKGANQSTFLLCLLIVLTVFN